MFYVEMGDTSQEGESEKALGVAAMILLLEKVPFYCLASRGRAKQKMFSPWVPVNKIRDRVVICPAISRRRSIALV